MTTTVAFLRAVNVGQRRVSMSRLKQAFVDLGYAAAWTYINSGNVVFDATGGRERLEAAIEAALESEFGFELTTFMRTAAELRTALDAEPFEMREGDTHFVTFLKAPPDETQTRQLEALSGNFDTLVVVGGDVHWHMRGKSSDSRLVKRDWERILGSNRSTSRNITMLRKLMAKLDG